MSWRWDERAADEVREVELASGHRVTTYSYGSGDEVLFLLNGGPGLPCDYLREPHVPLAREGWRVVTYDQLGTGRSERPSDPSLWTIGRYVEEVETVREALGLGRIHLLGHSWGGWLSIEYGITHPGKLKTLILADTCADMPHAISELNRLRAALGPETVALMQRHEAEGSLDHPAYQAAVTLLNYRHVCRLAVWPTPLQRSLADWQMPIYGIMQGPNEFLYTGNLKDWNRVGELHRIACPVLIVVGQHDEFTPACASRMQQALPHARVRVFPNASHMPFYEEPEAYYAALSTFLGAHRG